MLVSLQVRDLVVIDRVELDFGPGLTALTGETGAGKSILLDALGLALGARSDASLVRPQAERAVVTASFDVPTDHPAWALLDEQGMPVSDSLILRRVVQADGRSRAFINDEAASIGLLGQLGELLVEVHGQHDQRGLLRPESHRLLLDEFAGLAPIVASVATAWRMWREARTRLDDARADEARIRDEEETLRHDVAELESLAPEADEEAGLAAQRSRLVNAQRIAEALNGALDALQGDDGLDGRFRTAAGELARVRDMAAGMLDPVIAALDRAVAEANEAVAGIEQAGRDLESDAGRLEEIEARLFGLRAAARRHQVQVGDLVGVLARLKGRLALIDDREGVLAGLAADEAATAKVFEAACAKLTAARDKAAKKLDQKVAAELKPLKMGKATFETSLEPLDRGDWGQTGAERIAFLVATNPGSVPGPLQRIASGGELSRFMLALKVALAERRSSASMVFDEVDAGIGGAVADAVGERLQELGRQGQVLVVTHSPQVAARADAHVRIAKLTKAKSASVDAVALDFDARREEVARMLAGAKVTEEARAAADSLLKAGVT
jgi:DNA repair protein RecN (Recombination protein N)